MTIWQALRGWWRFLWAGVLVVGVAAASWQATWLNHVYRSAVLGFLLVAVVGIFAFGFRCPRCGASLLLKAHTILNRDRVVTCPHCGVSLDEPRDGATNR